MSQPRVYLFGTCLIDMFYPEAGLDAIALLKLCGFEPIFPQQQSCCGQPPYNSGHEPQAKAIAQHTLATFSEQHYPLIVPSASCAGMIKHHYPKLFADDPELRLQAHSLADRTHELIDFIAKRLPYETLTKQEITKVALHPSCSAQREMKVAKQWQQVLEKLPNVDCRLPERHHECCGFGGTFAIKSASISSIMTEDKARALLADSPDVITSGDCGCLMNIQGYIDKNLSKDTIPTETLPLVRFLAREFGVAHDD